MHLRVVSLVLCISLSDYAAGTFKHIKYMQGQITDAFILYTQTARFSGKLPEPSLYKKSTISRMITATFFMPAIATYVGPKKITTALYSIHVIPAANPVQGVCIELTYRPDKLAWQYYTLHDKRRQYVGNMLLLHDTQAVNNLVGNDLKCPIRWYSGIKHQPRIVLSGDCDIRFLQALHKLLACQGCEVFTCACSDCVSSYVQCQVQADLCIMLIQKQLCSEYTYTTYTKRVWSTLTYSQETKLKQLHACKKARAQTVACAINKQIKHMRAHAYDKFRSYGCNRECYAYQTPTIMLTVDASVSREHTQALAHRVKMLF